MPGGLSSGASGLRKQPLFERRPSSVVLLDGNQIGAAVCLSVCLVDAANDDEMIVSRIAARVWANQIRALIVSFNLQILSSDLHCLILSIQRTGYRIETVYGGHVSAEEPEGRKA